VSDNQPTTRQLAALFVVIAVATTIVLGVVTLRGGGPGGHTGPGASSALAARSNARSGVAGAASGARQRATSTTADLPAPTPSTAPVTTAPVTTAPVTTTPVTTTSVTTAPVTAPATVVPTTATTTLTRLGSGNGPPASLDVPTGSALAPLGPPAPGWRTAVALGGSGTGRSSVFTMTGHDSQVRSSTRRGVGMPPVALPTPNAGAPAATWSASPSVRGPTILKLSLLAAPGRLRSKSSAPQPDCHAPMTSMSFLVLREADRVTCSVGKRRRPIWSAALGLTPCCGQPPEAHLLLCSAIPSTCLSADRTSGEAEALAVSAQGPAQASLQGQDASPGSQRLQRAQQNPNSPQQPG